ncbi:hypothetical protein [Gracilibacillus salinarum]|uniref:Uncharacterized protein n=1 Tax=Gracilibacillus salinarum TaxID=2932255 RepID=A0ABY4GN18_9BACI|nr:hypothetical protein [Gracilibacillus salinarum]UOQ85707.1 hypothetical protein MUN87_02025 [Gracilibacillus salinarum]
MVDVKIKLEIKTTVDVEDYSILIKVYDHQLKKNFFCFEEDVEHLRDDGLRNYILDNMYDIKAGKFHVDEFEPSAKRDFPNILRRS